MSISKTKRPKLRGFIRVGSVKVPTPQQTKKQAFIKSRLLIFNPKALMAAKRRGDIF